MDLVEFQYIPLCKLHAATADFGHQLRLSPPLQASTVVTSIDHHCDRCLQPPPLLLATITATGIGLLYSELVQGIPPIFRQFIKKIPSIHSVFVFVSVKHIPISKVEPHERFLFLQLEPREFRLFKCVVCYGYRDAIETAKDFETSLIKQLKEFVYHEFFIKEGNQPIPNCQLEEPGTETTETNRRIAGKAPDETLKPQGSAGSESSGSILPANSNRSGNSSGIRAAALIPAIEEEIQFIQKEMGNQPIPNCQLEEPRTETTETNRRIAGKAPDEILKSQGSAGNNSSGSILPADSNRSGNSSGIRAAALIPTIEEEIQFIQKEMGDQPIPNCQLAEPGIETTETNQRIAGKEPDETLKPQGSAGSDSSGSILPADSNRPGNSSGIRAAALILAIEEEIQFIQKEMEKGVVYLLGETEMVAKPSSSIIKRAVVNSMYQFIKRNFRQEDEAMSIPKSRLLKVGVTYEI